MTLFALPFELWLRVFDTLTLPELLHVMRVCSFWRRLAILCDNYSLYIHLLSSTDGAIETFLLQLHRSRSRDSEVLVRVEQPCDALPGRILPAISQHVDHLRVLVLMCSAQYGDQVMELVRRPAPLLCELGLILKCDPPCAIAHCLPLDVLQGDQSTVRSVVLRNVLLPVSQCPPAFANVSSLNLMYDGLAEIIQVDDLWHCFPSLLHLAMLGAFIFGPAVCSDEQAWRNILSLDINIEDHCALHLLTNAPLERIPRIQFRFPGESTVDLSLGHLSGTLHLAFGVGIDDSDCFAVDISLTEMQSGKVRVSSWPYDHWYSPDMVGKFPSESIAERVVSLAVPTHLWGLLMYLIPPLVSIRDITIKCSRDMCMVDMIEAVRSPVFPHLANVGLVGDGFMANASFSDLGRLVMVLCGPDQPLGAPRVRLFLTGVSVDDMEPDRPTLFSEISVLP